MPPPNELEVVKLRQPPQPNPKIVDALNNLMVSTFKVCLIRIFHIDKHTTQPLQWPRHLTFVQEILMLIPNILLKKFI